MTLAAPVQPAQLALALDVVCDAPTAKECADLMRDLRRVSIGDVWQSGEYRIERDEDERGVDTVRFLRGAHVRGEWACDSANRLAAALRLIHVELVGAGITCGWLMCGVLYADALEQESDGVGEEWAYNGVDCDGKQEALVTVPLSFAPERIAVYGFDDDEVTLGDGTINVVQDGSPFKVSASRTFMRDPRLSRLNPAQASRVAQRLTKQGLGMVTAPASYKWCSEHETPRYVDTRLLLTDPVAYWEQRGFVPRHQFSDAPLVNGKPKYRDGKLPVCKACRNRHERLMYAALKAEQDGKRPYNRRTNARPKATARRVAA